MRVRSQKKLNIKDRMQRDIFSWKQKINRKGKCAPPKSIQKYYEINRSCEKVSLCVLRGSLTVEAAMIMPFFLTILLTFFSFFIQYASAAELKVQAAAEARKIAVTLGCVQTEAAEDVSASRSKTIEPYGILSIFRKYSITETAVCRSWIGFTQLQDVQDTQTYVYMTSEGSVYHLYGDCTHLKLSVKSTDLESVGLLKNDQGASYRPCMVCKEPANGRVYITSDGDCYHSERFCSGLKRTIHYVPMSSAAERSCCIRCMSRGE